MAALDPPDGIKFADFDLTLTDRDLDDFLSFMEHQTNGVYADSMPQLPDVAIDFPGLQLQPHSGSPSHSEGSESAGVGASGAATASNSAARQQGVARSDGSLTSATMSGPALEPAAANSVGNGQPPPQQQQQQQQVSPASSPMDISSQQHVQMLQQPQPVDIKAEPERQALPQQQQQQQQQQFFACGSLPAVLAASASSNAAATGTSLAGSLAAADSSTLMASCPGTLDMTSAGAFCLQPMQWHSSTAVNAVVAASAAAAVQQPGQQVSQAMPQLLFVQGQCLPALQQQQQQQQPSPVQQQAAAPFGQAQQQQGQPMGLLQPSGMSQQLAAFAGLTAGPSSSTQMERQASLPAAAAEATRSNRQQLQQLQQQRAAAAYSDAGGGSKLQISHSTVEKQRRDRLNSLIDELSDMVPPADPKYGSDTNSVRRPKHVVLADTINLLKAMQTKLQIEEAEICTLKQQAAAVGAIAAQHQVGHAAVPEAADALMHAAAAGAAGGGASPDTCPGGIGGYAEACGVAVELPTAPESSANSTGVLVEQGIGCLYVKVNCKDRTGLLSDVVSALKGLPIVISTAAITTTKDGTVHDVFEVRVEDVSVTAEDIQWAVQQALFTGDRARSNACGGRGPT